MVADSIPGWRNEQFASKLIRRIVFRIIIFSDGQQECSTVFATIRNLWLHFKIVAFNVIEAGFLKIKDDTVQFGIYKYVGMYRRGDVRS